MRKIQIIGIVAVVAIAGIVFLMPKESPAAPVIRWTPESVTETISPGATKTITVSFVSSEDLQDVEVRVVPELIPVLRTVPVSFPKIGKNEVIDLMLMIAEGYEVSFGEYAGTVHLVSGSKTIARTLPVVLTNGELYRDENLGYQIEHLANMTVTPTTVIRPKFIGGQLFADEEEGLSITIDVYSNDSNLPILEWYESTLSAREFTEDDRQRAIDPLVVAGLEAIKVYSLFMGNHHLRHYVAHGSRVYGIETTVPDDNPLPVTYFNMLDTFRAY